MGPQLPIGPYPRSRLPRHNQEGFEELEGPGNNAGVGRGGILKTVVSGIADAGSFAGSVASGIGNALFGGSGQVNKPGGDPFV